ncbi:histone family protein nucleoid-structuring protein H-NS [Delftia sp. 670]|jgi:DNA-binding protein H-NS|uniref:H-NS histone family protein n=1 Tax=Delftia TaxID=80865 RepID=UPI0004DA8C9D|nr:MULTISPECIES: H-NS histone family protein [Delftia]KEH13782.1 histone family protein nucleoid-structuring protein H-NS [Delftia sp. 670]
MSRKYKSLMQEKAALDAKIAEHYGAMRLDAIDAARDLVKQHHLKVCDLFALNTPINARYRNPKTGETWTGRGRPPRWIEGRDRKPFEV